MNSLIELLLQRAFGFGRQPALLRFFPRKLRQDRQLVFHIIRGDAVPKSVLKLEHIKLLLLDPENLRMRKLHKNFIGPYIDGEVLPQIESGFDCESAMHLDPLGTSRPGVREFMFHFDAARKNGQFARRGGLLEINAIVDRDARLQMRDVDENSPQIFAEPLQFSGALVRAPGRPSLEPDENENHGGGNYQYRQAQRYRPGNPPRRRLLIWTLSVGS